MRASSDNFLSAENLSLHNISNLQAPFSHPGAVSEISGLSFDHTLWAANQQPHRDSDAVSKVSGAWTRSELERKSASTKLNEFHMNSFAFQELLVESLKI